MHGSLTARKTTLHQASECFNHVTVKRNLSAEPQSLTNTVLHVLMVEQSRADGSGNVCSCTRVCVCVCVRVMAETRYIIKRVLILIASLFSVDFAKCVFPFWYRRLIYWGCTEDGDSFGKAWCSLTRNYNKDRVWKYCDWGEIYLGEGMKTFNCSHGKDCTILVGKGACKTLIKRILFWDTNWRWLAVNTLGFWLWTIRFWYIYSSLSTLTCWLCKIGYF